MIYTVTLNPSLDYILDSPAVQLGQVNRVAAARMTFGGKGISQSVVLTGLGVPNLALGLAGGYTGGHLRTLLKERGVRESLIETKGDTRINVKLRAEQKTEINTPGPIVSPKELQSLLDQMERLRQGDVLSFGGSVPPGVPLSVIRDILNRLQDRKSVV